MLPDPRLHCVCSRLQPASCPSMSAGTFSSYLVSLTRRLPLVRRRIAVGAGALGLSFLVPLGTWLLDDRLSSQGMRVSAAACVASFRWRLGVPPRGVRVGRCRRHRCRGHSSVGGVASSEALDLAGISIRAGMVGSERMSPIISSMVESPKVDSKSGRSGSSGS